MLGTFLTAIDWFGTAVFAVTGAHVASRKRMDISGFILLGCATGMGGGTLRDAMLGALPVFWVREPVYLAVCVGVSAAKARSSCASKIYVTAALAGATAFVGLLALGAGGAVAAAAGFAGCFVI